MALHVGDPAPPFSATSDQGQTLDLEALRGKWVLLFFYPKAGSRGCSVEARGFETLLPDFERLNTQVIGISTDTEAHQAKFRQGCTLHFPLIPDSDKKICTKYGVLGLLSVLTGQADRQTFLIDPEGKVARHWRFVNPFSHASEVLEQLQRLTGYTETRESQS
ncbi:peroxiredoxin [Deinococcus cellulosilyticus]|uniref:thioredoxin-dependent peroxiredoxin n=1 Tax=Deinococcus cellulosilyticus (strain DSM 18568 / NBRC 106333 / KACC 11606 / 5516J-15) TaxID=1223518 RepID=A0A511MX36_DEIC1|nr:peroxiredoxin [Deinococcus cellulosilyticus]GEM45139.1 peroxiredoxin [Deinococcus cellulosilyticus NBRC 106333 = KACC 11606]